MATPSPLDARWLSRRSAMHTEEDSRMKFIHIIAGLLALTAGAVALYVTK